MDSVRFSDEKLMRRSATMPALMLKDYLLDDMSSCSSNGFPSFPRRKCSSSGESKRKASAFRRASKAVIKAVKIFPLSYSKRKSSILPRSLSSKVFRRSFWIKASEKDTGFLKSFKCLNESSLSVSQPSSAVAAAVVENAAKSMSDNSSLFTPDTILSSSRSSESSCENGVVFTEDSKRVAVTVGNESSASSTEASKEEWVRILEQKEQFSPISVLDFPLDDDVSWPFRRTNSKSLSKLKPVNLDKQFANNNNNEDFIEMVKRACPNLSQFGHTIEGLLVDFFTEKVNNKVRGEDMVKVVENWINGNPNQMFLGWELEENRKVYIKYIDSGGNFDDEKKEMAKEIENGIFDSLLAEMLLGCRFL